MRLILASSSPYRHDMLKRLGLPFTAISPEIDESPQPGESPVTLAVRLSRAKADAITARHPEALVIGSDQVASFDGQCIGKPGSHDNAVAQLRMLSGRSVEFHSALCLSNGHKAITENVITTCRFRTLDDLEIQNYLERERPYDTAGSAKAESLGIALMESMSSDDPTAIIGLPLIALSRMLRRFGVNPLLASTGTCS